MLSVWASAIQPQLDKHSSLIRNPIAHVGIAHPTSIIFWSPGLFFGQPH
jgi:hypothetical protein